MLKDVYLLDWLNINCMRTSHYPYSEEFMQMTDLLGIAVIDEVPAVGLSQHDNFSPVQLNLHKNLLKELFDRDNHHASVIMWSLANEPGTEIPAAVPYFQ
jgi:beta-glucuronidase